MRIRCHLFGCNTAEYPSTCSRCDAELYDGDWIQVGWSDSAVPYWVKAWLTFGLRFIVGRKCGTCGKRFRNGATPYCCSPECADAWIPF